MSQGSKAMLAAQARRLLNNRSQRETAKVSGVSQPNVAFAEMVLEWAPELADAGIERK